MLIVYLFWLVTFPLLVLADEKEALTFYQQAEKYNQQKEYQQALEYYQQALQMRANDGQVTVDKNIVTQIVAKGRSVEKVSIDRSKRVDYLPNLRISQIKNLLDERYRRTHPPELAFSWISLREPTHDNVLDGGEKGNLIFELKNIGKSQALGVNINAQVDDADGISIKNHETIANIDPNESVTVMLDLVAERSVADKTRRFLVRAKEQTGFDSNEIDVILHTKPHRPEHLVVHVPIVNDFNNNMLIEPSETVEVAVDVENTGLGVSQSITAMVELGENVYLGANSESTVALGEIFPGEIKSIYFTFITNKRIQHGQELPIKISLIDSAGKEQASRALGLSAHVPKDKTKVSLSPKSRVTRQNTNIFSDGIEIDLSYRKPKDKFAVAVVIGNKSYSENGVPQVKYAHNDAKMMKRYLVDLLGYHENNILYYEDATTAKFHEIFGTQSNYAGRLFNFVEPGKSKVFIYYSGHGAPDLKNKGTYFVPVDANPNYLSYSGYSLNVFYNNIAKLPAINVTVVLDACFSGDSDGGFLFKNISPVMVKSNSKPPLMKNTVIFSSSLEDQVSTWYHEKRHGLFTYYFLRGLKGFADKNKDLQITSTELNHFVNEKVPYKARRLTGSEQTPMLTQQKDMVMVGRAQKASVMKVER